MHCFHPNLFWLFNAAFHTPSSQHSPSPLMTPPGKFNHTTYYPVGVSLSLFLARGTVSFLFLASLFFPPCAKHVATAIGVWRQDVGRKERGISGSFTAKKVSRHVQANQGKRKSIFNNNCLGNAC